MIIFKSSDFLKIDCWHTDQIKKSYCVYPSIEKNCGSYTEEGYSQIFYFSKKEIHREINNQKFMPDSRLSFFHWVLEGNLKANDSRSQSTVFDDLSYFFGKDYAYSYPELRPLFSPLITQSNWKGKTENGLEPKFEIDQTFSRYFHLSPRQEPNLRWILLKSDKESDEDIVTIYKEQNKGVIASDRLKQFCDDYELGILEVISIIRKFLSKEDASKFYRDMCTDEDNGALFKRDLSHDDKCIKLVNHWFPLDQSSSHKTHFHQVRQLYLGEIIKKDNKRLFRSFYINEQGDEKPCKPLGEGGYFEQVAFEKEVLVKYINNEYYEFSESRLEKNPRSKHEEGFELTHIDNFHPDLVLVPLNRLSDLPSREQDHWKKYNTPELYKKYDVKFSNHYISAACYGIPSKPDKKSLSLQKQILDSFKSIQKIMPCIFFKEARNIINDLQIIKITNKKEFLNFCFKLEQLFYAYIDKTSLEKILKTKNDAYARGNQGESFNEGRKQDYRKDIKEAFQLSDSDKTFLEAFKDFRNFNAHKNDVDWNKGISNIKKILDEKEDRKVFFDKESIDFKEMSVIFFERLSAIMSRMEEVLRDMQLT